MGCWQIIDGVDFIVLNTAVVPTFWKGRKGEHVNRRLSAGFILELPVVGRD